MDHAALEYLQRRAAEEASKAERAPSLGIAKIHRMMADAYVLKIRTDSKLEIHPASDVPIDHPAMRMTGVDR